MQATPADAIRNPILLLLYINDLPKSIDYRIEKTGKLVIIQAQHFLTNNFPFASHSK